MKGKVLAWFSGKRRMWVIAGIFVVFIGLGLVIYRVTGHQIGIRALAVRVLHTVRAIADRGIVRRDNLGQYTDIIFLHHSVGYNLIEDGNVRTAFLENGYHFWDHDYNDPGLRDSFGVSRGYSYSVPDDNTDPDGLANIFSQPVYDLPLNTFSALLQHEVIMVKSCFPNSAITSEEELAGDQANYRKMRAAIQAHPEKIFVILTSPPLIPEETNPADAARARAMADWLISEDFKAGNRNIFVFDFYHLLAESDLSSPEVNMLRSDYRNGSDSHPNRAANQAVAPQLVSFVIQSIQAYKTGR